MQKYRAVLAGLLFSFSTLGMMAQVASGNVAESSHPRADVLQAQNPRVHRTLEGCISREGNEYRLVVKPSDVIYLTASSSDMLAQHAGQRVKVRGNLLPMVAQDDEASAAKPAREMTVERIQGVSGFCAAH